MGNILVPSGTSFNPWYTAHAHKHVRIHTSCALLALAHTHTPCHENGGGVRSSTSVMEQEVLEQSALHNIQLPPTCGQE